MKKKKHHKQKPLPQQLARKQLVQDPWWIKNSRLPDFGFNGQPSINNTFKLQYRL